MKQIKNIFLLIPLFLLLSCKLPISSKKYELLPISKEKINVENNNIKNIIKYKYCDNVILYIIPTGFKNKNLNYVSNKAIEEYNKISNTNYKYIENVKTKRYVYHFPPIFYRICVSIEGNIGGFNEKNI